MLVTVLVVSLLLVMTLALTVFVRLELRRVVSRQETVQARANALLGARLAVAQLQELLGPDQRVSARAELFDGSVTNLSGMPSPAADHPKWIGVWDSEGVEDASPDEKPFLDWLISRGAGGAVPLLDEGSVEDSNDHIQAGLDRARKRLDDVLLPDDLVKLLRAPFPR